MKHSDITHAALVNALDYDPETGAFRWKVRPSRAVSIGDEVGALGPSGRRIVGIFGEKHSAQRLAWFYVKGEWPKGNVAPLNGDYGDARFENLRDETAAQTAQRGAMRSTNTSGYKGVSWSKQAKGWIATFTRSYRRVQLGPFDSKEEAASAYVRAVNEADSGAGVLTWSAEQIRERRKLRRLWEKTQLRAGGETGWASLEHFAEDFPDLPPEGYVIVAADSSIPVGPGNFEVKAPVKKYASQQRGYHRPRNLRDKFGLSMEDYQRMFAEQRGVCDCCGQPETAIRNGEVKWLAVDHDHVTGEVRSLVCSRCNVMIGMADENPDYALKVAKKIREIAEAKKARAVRDNVYQLRKEGNET